MTIKTIFRRRCLGREKSSSTVRLRWGTPLNPRSFLGDSQMQQAPSFLWDLMTLLIGLGANPHRDQREIIFGSKTYVLNGLTS